MNFYYEEDRKDIYIGLKEPLVYPAHFHKNIELVYIISGTARGSADGIECKLKKGDFFIAFPEVVHYYDQCENIDSVVIIVSADLFPEYSRLFLTKQPISPQICNAPDDAKKIIELLELNSKNYTHNIKKGLLLALMGILLPCLELVENSNTSHSTIQEILHYCSNNYKTNISVKSTATALHISPSHISHTFAAKFHTSFREYINTLRLNDAINLMENTQKNISEIAFETGFETIRTFNRVFKQYYGVTPIEYKKFKSADCKIYPPNSHLAKLNPY